MSKELVLVAEDDVVYAEVLRRRLETMGYRVAGIAINGAEAIDQSQQMHPDIVLMDRELAPNASGPDVGTRIDKELDIPVVYMTSHITDLSHAGFDSTKHPPCVIIPCSNSELKRSLEFTLQEHRQRQYVRQIEQSHRETNEELETILDAASHDLRGSLIHLSEINEHLKQYAVPREPSSGKPVQSNSESAPPQAVLEKDFPDFLDMIPLNLIKMHRIVDGLLKLSRAGRTSGASEVIEVRPLILSLLQTESSYPNTEFQIVVDELPPCRAEAPHVRKVFSQLILNAIQNLSEDRPGQIHITGHRKGKQSIYCVEDNGLGISEFKQPTIFTPFCPIHPDTPEREGLGLSLVRRIVHRYQGRVWLESTPARGSRFYVSFPAE